MGVWVCGCGCECVCEGVCVRVCVCVCVGEGVWVWVCVALFVYLDSFPHPQPELKCECRCCKMKCKLWPCLVGVASHNTEDPLDKKQGEEGRDGRVSGKQKTSGAPKPRGHTGQQHRKVRDPAWDRHRTRLYHSL